MKECQKADGNGCSFIDDDGACIPSLPKLTLVLQKSKPSQQQQQKSKIWNYICQIIACSLLEDSNLDMKKIKKKLNHRVLYFVFITEGSIMERREESWSAKINLCIKNIWRIYSKHQLLPYQIFHKGKIYTKQSYHILKKFTKEFGFQIHIIYILNPKENKTSNAPDLSEIIHREKQLSRIARKGAQTMK